MNIKYPFTKQHDLKDCGASCLSMIIKYYDGYISLDNLKEMTETSKNGVSAYNLVKTAKNIGFDAKGIEIEFDEIYQNIKLPSIAFTLIDNTYKHYIVVYKIDCKKQILIIGDPASKIKKMSFLEFKKIYKNIMITLEPVHKIPKYKENKLIKRIISDVIKDSKKEIIKLIIYSLILTFLSIVSSLYFKIIIDNYNQKKLFFIIIFIIFLFIEIIKHISEYIRNKIFININKKIDLVLTYDVFKKIITLPFSYYRSKTTGEVISRFNDLSKIKELISKIMLTLFVDLLLAFVSLIFLFIINKILFFIALIILILYILVILVFRPVLKELLNSNIENQSIVNSYLIEAVNGFETVKGINIEENIIGNFNEKYNFFMRSYINLNNIYNLENLIKNIVYYIGYTVIIFMSSMSFEIITVGEIVLFVSLLTYFLEPVKNIISLDTLIRESKLAVFRINFLIDYDIKEGLINIEKIDKIEIKNANYSVNNKLILEEIKLKISSKDKIMVIGENGSGKSSLLKLIKNYYKTNSVYLNDININNMTKKTLDKISYISQNEILFTDTIYNNIVLNRQIENEKVLKVMKLFYIDKICRESNLGYNYLIEENGFNISGGEKQRIILARTFLSESEVILIDEGFSEIDINLERKILKNIFSSFKDKIIIVVTHKKDNIDLFDKLIKMDNKRILETLKKNKE